MNLICSVLGHLMLTLMTLPPPPCPPLLVHQGLLRVATVLVPLVGGVVGGVVRPAPCAATKAIISPSHFHETIPLQIMGLKSHTQSIFRELRT